MSSDDEMIQDARTFFALAQEGGIDDVLNSESPLKIGIDLENDEVFIGVHDKVYFMNMDVSAALLQSLFLAIRTIEAARAAREN